MQQEENVGVRKLFDDDVPFFGHMFRYANEKLNFVDLLLSFSLV